MPEMTGEFQLLPQQDNQKVSLTIRPKSRAVLYSSLVLVFIVLIWGALMFYKQSLMNQIKTTDSKIAAIQAARNYDNEEVILTLDHQLSVFNNLYGSHVYWTQGLSELFKLIKPEVRLNSLSGEVTKGAFAFGAVAPSYTVLAQQLHVFLNDKDVKSMNFGGLSKDDSGKISFDVLLTVSVPKYFYKR